MEWAEEWFKCFSIFHEKLKNKWDLFATVSEVHKVEEWSAKLLYKILTPATTDYNDSVCFLYLLQNFLTHKLFASNDTKMLPSIF